MSTVIEIVEAIAEAENVDPSELEIQLHDYVDVDAVRSLVAHRRDSWTVRFEIPDHIVRVTGQGVVTVDGSETGTHSRNVFE
ncbi:MAG: HalOD1 output domain-containing protein [Natronomonas sp.]